MNDDFSTVSVSMLDGSDLFEFLSEDQMLLLTQKSVEQAINGSLCTESEQTIKISFELTNDLSEPSIQTIDVKISPKAVTAD